MLVITGGDVFGTNTEAINKILRQEPSVPVVVCASYWHFADQCERMNLALPNFKFISELHEASESFLYFLDLKVPKNYQISADELSDLARGEIAIAALEICKEIPAKKFAVLTGPIDKAACVAAGFGFGGQTEYFESIWDHPACMVLAGPKLKVGLATNHLALRDVADSLSSEGIAAKLKLFQSSLQKEWGIASPSIAVCALNPHAGDNGLFGSEDSEIIQPAIEIAKEAGLNVTGPVPADTAFYQGYTGKYDGVFAMYHDQGLGPLKLVHFDTAVNISGGLPHLRLSPDHGPVKDQYLKGTVSIKSWQTAFEIAINYLTKSEDIG